MADRVDHLNASLIVKSFNRLSPTHLLLIFVTNRAPNLIAAFS